MSDAGIIARLRQYDVKLAAAKVAHLEQSLADKTIKSDGAQCWAELRAALREVANNPPGKLVGKFFHSNFSTSPEEDHCRLAISFLSTRPRHSYADLWYRRGDKRIRTWTTLSCQESALFLGVVDERICLTSESHPEPDLPPISQPLITGVSRFWFGFDTAP